MENQTEEIYGTIFDEVPIISEDHLELLLSTMSNQEAIYYLVQASKSAHNRGAFSIGECEIISKAIRILFKKEESESV